MPKPERRSFPRIVSGGQTGVDRAALDAALELGFPLGGWCPSGRVAEDGPIPDRYPLRETPSADAAQRTEWNVRDSEATLVLTRGVARAGTAVALRQAQRAGRPVRVVDLGHGEDPLHVAAWIRSGGFTSLNVAGPRESELPGVYTQSRNFLMAVLRHLDPGAG